MSGVLIHDGRRGGHRKWSSEAVKHGAADGVILTPFSSPRVSKPRHPSAGAISSDILGLGGEVIFDPMTHARLLSTTNKVDFYDEWELWGPAGVDLSTDANRIAHVERVFDRQDQVGSPRVAPTLTLTSPQSPTAYAARDTARVARAIDLGAWQAIAGTRAFWASEEHLDAFVGSLVALKAPAWILTVVNEVVLDQTPDLSNTKAFTGLCRTVHSLALRSRVIIAHADFSGLPAVAAGADTIGSGWDRAQRTFDPISFRVDSDPGIRIPASYVTQGRLHAVLRRDTADAIERWDTTAAAAIRGGAMPVSDNVERMHHLAQLRAAVSQVASISDRSSRVQALRGRYEQAKADFVILQDRLKRIVSPRDDAAWRANPQAVLDAYATAEGIA